MTTIPQTTLTSAATGKRSGFLRQASSPSCSSISGSLSVGGDELRDVPNHDALVYAIAILLSNLTGAAGQFSLGLKAPSSLSGRILPRCLWNTEE